MKTMGNLFIPFVKLCKQEKQKLLLFLKEWSPKDMQFLACNLCA